MSSTTANALAVSDHRYESDICAEIISVDTQTQEGLAEGFAATQEEAQRIRERCRARDEAEGKRVYLCPFCTLEEQVKMKNNGRFKTAAACKRHITSRHSARVDLMKLEKKDPQDWAPVEKILSPKRRLEDIMTPEQIVMHNKLKQYKEEVGPMLAVARDGDPSKEPTADQLINKPSSLALPQMSKLSDKELAKYAYLVKVHGKTDILRQVNKYCHERKVSLWA